MGLWRDHGKDHRDRKFGAEQHFVETALPGTTYEMEVTAGESLRIFLVPIHLHGRMAVRSASFCARVDLATAVGTTVAYALAVYQVLVPRPPEKPSAEPAPLWRAKLIGSFPQVQAVRSASLSRLDTFLQKDLILDPRDGIFMVAFQVRSSSGASYMLTPMQTNLTPHRATRAKEFGTAIGVFPDVVTVFDSSLTPPYICLRSAVGAIVYG